MAPRNMRTLLVNSGGFPRGTSHADMVVAIHHAFEDEIESVQVCPGNLIRVTFVQAESKTFYEDLGSIPFGTVVCSTLKPEFVSVVLVHLFPFEGDNSKIQEALKVFGVIKEVKFQTWTNVPGLYTGTRIVRMVRNSHIPRNIKIDGLPCKVWYRDQPIECDICRGGHKAASCPLKGKCRRCRKEGHLARDCSEAPWSRDAAEAPVSVAQDPTPAEAVAPVASETVAAPSAVVVSHMQVDADSPPVTMNLDSSVDVRDNQLDEVIGDAFVEESQVSLEAAPDSSPQISSFTSDSESILNDLVELCDEENITIVSKAAPASVERQFASAVPLVEPPAQSARLATSDVTQSVIDHPTAGGDDVISVCSPSPSPVPSQSVLSVCPVPPLPSSESSSSEDFLEPRGRAPRRAHKPSHDRDPSRSRSRSGRSSPSVDRSSGSHRMPASAKSVPERR